MDKYGLAAYGVEGGYRGTIDLNNRVPLIVGNTIKTEESMSFDPDREHTVTIPTVINGKKVSDKEAIKHYDTTGEYLDATGRGEFGPLSNKNYYNIVNSRAHAIHNRQAQEYGGLAELFAGGK
jgi:hypothetical protein